MRENWCKLKKSSWVVRTIQRAVYEAEAYWGEAYNRQWKSARRYIARNKTRSSLSTIFLLGKPEAEPETTSTVTDDIACPVRTSFLFPRLSGRAKRSRVIPGSDKSQGRHLGESPRFVRVVGERARPGRENAATDISAGLIGYPYARHLSPDRSWKISRAIRGAIHLRWLRSRAVTALENRALMHEGRVLSCSTW